MKQLYLIFIFLLLITSPLFSQTGPGGVGNSSNNALWIDPSRLQLTNGDDLIGETDFSGNNVSLSAPSNSTSGKFSTNVINGNPAINFNGSQYLNTSSISMLDNDKTLTWIVVGRTSNPTAIPAQVLMCSNYNGQTNSNSSYYSLYSQSLGSYRSHFRKQSSGALKNLYGSGTSFSIATNTMNTNVFNTYLNNSFASSSTGSVINYTTHNRFTLGNIASNPDYFNYHLRGDIAEVIVFNKVLNDIERIIIDNYLSSKYSIDITASGNDFYAQEGTGHFHEVFGIGQFSGQTHSTAQGSGIVEVSSPNDLSNDEYLFIGHDNQDFNLYNGDVPPSMPDAERWNRTWRVSETGEVGTVTLTFDMTGVGFGSPVTSYRLLIDPNQDGNFSDVVTPIIGTFDIATETLTFTNVNLSDGDYFTVAADRAIISINGGGNWTDPLTWNCFCVPTHLDSAIIDDGHTVTVDSDTAIKGLMVNGTGNLDLNGNNLDIRESLTMNGGFASNGGSLTFNGIVSSTFDLGGQTLTFDDIIMNVTGADLTLNNGTLLFNGTFFPTDGTLNDGSALITINSTSATATGEIGPIGSSAVINETSFRILRFAPGGVAENREISSPLNGMKVTELDDDFEISGSGMPDGCSYGGSGCYASLKYYDSPSSAYVDVNDVNHTMVTGRGYEMWFGQDLTNWSGVTYDMNGTINDGSDIVKNFGGGYDLEFIGNPYASAIDFDQLQLSDVYDHFYVYDASVDNYQWYCSSCGSGGTPDASISDLSGGIIALGQGFWVEDINNGSLTFTQSAKVSDGETFIRNESVKHTLYISDLNSHRQTDLSFAINANASLEKDASDLANMPRVPGRKNLRLSSVTAFGEELRLNNISGFEDKLELPLSFEATEDSRYVITSSNFEDMIPYQCKQLFDQVTGDIIELNENTSYEFDFIADGSQNNRFTLLLNKEACSSTPGSSNTASIDGEESEGLTFKQRDRVLEFNFNFSEQNQFNVQIVNTLGQDVMNTLQWNVSSGIRTLQIPENIHGVLIIKLFNENEQFVEKVFVK